MERFEKTNGGIIAESGYFDARATLTCGQLFRFYKADSGFILISGDKKCTLRPEKISEKDCLQTERNTEKDCLQTEKNTEISVNRVFTADKFRTFITTDHPDYFYDYFDFATDYSEIIRKLSAFTELTDCLSIGRGIHILKQQLFETIISFIISANNNIPRIQGIIERLVAKYGTKMDGYYAFPTAAQLKDVKSGDYLALGAGYRADYLESTVHKILETDILQVLPTLDYEGALKLLLSLKGVGRKVADCICLFALKLTECYPADTWIRKAEGGGSAEQARQKGMERYGKLAGYAQQYKFYSHIAERDNV